MYTQEEQKTKSPDVTLYRCSCEHCDTAQETLAKLSNRHGAKFTIKSVEVEPYMERFARWSTPIVCVNGKQISHYSMSAAKWEQAIKGELDASPLSFHGEVLDLVCYMKDEARGPKHKSCAESCIREGGAMGLLAQEGQVYLLIKDRDNPQPYEMLKGSVAEDVEVTGELYRRGGVQTIIVKTVDRRHGRR